MTTILALIGLFMFARAQQSVPVRYVPAFDPDTEASFRGLGTICGNAPYEGGIYENNDARRPLEELFGTITLIEVHQFGPAFKTFQAVEMYLRDLLVQRPRTAFRYHAWANGTPLSKSGAAGTFHFANGTRGVFQATTVYFCAQDSRGLYWWVRLSLAGGDLWPSSR